MKKLAKKIKKFAEKLKNQVLLDSSKRKRFELFIITAVFFLAGTTFTIINFSTNEFELGYVTLSFGIIALLSALCALFMKKWSVVAEILFVLSALIMFFYFLIAGGAGDVGFSTYWIILLPFVAVMVLGLIKGSFVAIGMFVCIALILWIPAIRDSILKWHPDSTFCLRFPLVYLAASAASILFEISRHLTDKANEELNKKLEQAATHDSLTGLTNRFGLSNIIQNFDYRNNDFHEEMTVANCVLIDLDNFKSANDIYGHMFGDEVLVEVAKVLRKYAGEYAVRFGGDEFVLLFMNKTTEDMLQIGENIRKDIENITYDSHPDVHYTASVGVASHEVNLAYQVDRVIALADTQSGKAKRDGKNKVYQLTFEDEVKTKIRK